MDTVKINHGNTKMIAHRGLSGIEQENTNAAFVAAGNRSYYGIETDVHRTADGQYVIIHDDTTARVTNGAWNVNVEQVPYRDIQAILLPDRDGSCTRQDLRIPLLAEYVRICKRYEKVCVLELKNPFLREDIENIIEIVRGEEYLSNVISLRSAWKTAPSCGSCFPASGFSGCFPSRLMRKSSRRFCSITWTLTLTIAI